MQIGIETHTGKVLEGKSLHGHYLEMPIFLSPCAVHVNECMGNDTKGPGMKDPFGHLMFREDFFDPISRVRRGRLYKPGNYQPSDWFYNGVRISADTYYSHSVYPLVREHTRNNLHIAMGDERRFTLWKIVDIEVIYTGEELLTLRSVHQMGILPDVNANTPEPLRKASQDAVNRLSDDIYRSSPESIVDLCLDGMTKVVGLFLGKEDKEPNVLISELGKAPLSKGLAEKSAFIINYLHTRRKPHQQNKLNLRPITDEDAMIAVQCFGLILVELGIANY